MARQAQAAAITARWSERGVLYVDGHSALADDADWNASTWSFNAEGRARLLAALDLIYDNLPARFSLEAPWIGDATRNKQPIARADLRKLIAENQLGNRILYIVDTSDPWFPLWVGPPPRPLTQDERAFIDEARALMGAIAPSRASSTWASLYVSELTLVVPLDRQPLDGLDVGDPLDPSLQLHMCTRGGGDVILGDWQDADYAWDEEPKAPALKVAGHGTEARSSALGWLESEMRKPFVRRDWRVFGRTVCSGWWTKASDGSDQLLEIGGFFPAALIGRNRYNNQVPAGYFDSWSAE